MFSITFMWGCVQAIPFVVVPNFRAQSVTMQTYGWGSSRSDIHIWLKILSFWTRVPCVGLKYTPLNRHRLTAGLQDMIHVVWNAPANGRRKSQSVKHLAGLQISRLYTLVHERHVPKRTSTSSAYHSLWLLFQHQERQSASCTHTKKVT